MEKEFTIKVKMRERWIPYFLGMLNLMERLGKIGASREITFYSDGDGDFNPKFEFDEKFKDFIKKEKNGCSKIDNRYFIDAG